MAFITKGSDISLDANSGQKAAYISELTAGSPLYAGDLVYIDSNAKVLRAVSTVKTTGSIVFTAGMVARDYASGEAVTVFGNGARFNYGSSLTAGEYLYSGSIAGSLVNAPTVETDLPVALVVSSTDIVLVK